MLNMCINESKYKLFSPSKTYFLEYSIRIANTFKTLFSTRKRLVKSCASKISTLTRYHKRIISEHDWYCCDALMP